MATQVTLNSGSVDSAGSLALKTNGTTTAVTIDTSQNVGIGTASPTVKMQLKDGRAWFAPASENYAIKISYNDATQGVWLGSPAANVMGFYDNNGSERARIDSSGNVGIGTSSPLGKLHVSASGLSTIYMSDTGEATNQKNWTFQYGTGVGTGTFRLRALNDANNAGQNAYIITRTGVAVDTHQWLTADTERARIDSSGNLLVGTTSANGGLFTVNGNMGPATDNARTCANAFYRWSVVFAATGTINTSDAREKTPVRSLSASEVTASQQLANEIGAYKWLSAVAEKGDAAREHIGMTVQRAIEIMEANGLSPFTYGFICFDENEEMSRYSFRMDELSMFIAKGQQQAIQEQQALITTLTDRITALENK